jgi:biopolymer transport protein ExbD
MTNLILSKYAFGVSAPPSAERRRRIWLRAGPKWYGLILATILSLLYIPFTCFIAPMSRMIWEPSKGLLVSLLTRESPIPPSPGIQPLIVRVVYTGANAPPQVELNWRRVEWKDLARLVRKEMATRPPEWPVYVTGDAGLEWRQVVPVIEIIQGLNVKAALVAANK